MLLSTTHSVKCFRLGEKLKGQKLKIGSAIRKAASIATLQCRQCNLEMQSSCYRLHRRHAWHARPDHMLLQWQCRLRLAKRRQPMCSGKSHIMPGESNTASKPNPCQHTRFTMRYQNHTSTARAVSCSATTTRALPVQGLLLSWSARASLHMPSSAEAMHQPKIGQSCCTTILCSHETA